MDLTVQRSFETKWTVLGSLSVLVPTMGKYPAMGAPVETGTETLRLVCHNQVQLFFAIILWD